MEATALDTTFATNDWEEYALRYDSLMHLHPYREMLYDVAREVPPNRQETILDASCGTGNFEQSLLMLSEIYFKEIIGIDSSVEMLSRAKKKTSDHKNIRYLEADLNNSLPFSDYSMTSVVSINTLYAVTDPKVTLTEFHRVLSLGGKLILVTPKRGCENGFILQSHCKSDLPDSFWKNMHKSVENEERLIHEAIKDEKIVSDMLMVGKFNRSIVANKTFHFFHMNELFKLLMDVGFTIESMKVTYAEQALFFVVTKTKENQNARTH